MHRLHGTEGTVLLPRAHDVYDRGQWSLQRTKRAVHSTVCSSSPVVYIETTHLQVLLPLPHFFSDEVIVIVEQK